MVTILVGPQGSGKSTYALNNSTHPIIISQDSQGPKGHMDAFKKALESAPNSEHIIVDRINHTREQRARYIDLARKAGWSTEILVMNLPFGTCLDRIVARTGHPTINSKEVGIQALRTYFNQYQRPTMDEADKVIFLTTYDPFMMDLNNIYPAGTRYIVIGDVHGCYDELMELLEKMKYRKGEDVIIFCGDLIDRGPKIDEVLRFARTTPRVHSVKGNHEDKLARHMANLGTALVSKIKIGHGLQNTIDQCGDRLDDDMMCWFWSLPLIIKFNNSYVFHAGINPRYSMLRQNREFLLYARKFNASLNTFDDENSPPWYEHELHESLKNRPMFFGHEVHGITDPLHFASHHMNKNVFPMDGGCYFGGNLLGASIKDNVTQFDYVPSRQPIEVHEPLYVNWNEPYEDRVKAGYLSKSETPDLVLYNYTDKCTYDKAWDKYTLECRGLIFEKATGKVIARPFGKFFNMGETEETQRHNLPKESYSCFEKMDGSLGIIFYYKGKWHVATRGSFYSEQAVKAAEMLGRYNLDVLGHAVGANVTLLAEIIYPANKIVVNYGNEEKLVLLGAFCSIIGEEFSYEDLQRFSKNTRMPIAPKFDYTIEQMVALQETLPADKEGFVVRFASGMRVKIKGREYMRISKILSSITPLTMWELMLDSKDFSVPSTYMMEVPEEYRDDVLSIVYKLKERRNEIIKEIQEDFEIVLMVTGISQNGPVTQEMKKIVGLYMTKGTGRSNLKHPSMIFALINGKIDAVEAYSRKMTRPKANVLS